MKEKNRKISIFKSIALKLVFFAGIFGILSPVAKAWEFPDPFRENLCGSKDLPGTSHENCRNIPEYRRIELSRRIQGGVPVAIKLIQGVLSVVYFLNGGELQSCDITTKVKKVRVSSNYGDLSTAYFIREGHMWDVKMNGEVGRGQCPKATKQDYSETLGSLADHVEDIKLSPNSRNEVTAVGLTSEGNLIISTDTRIYLKVFFNVSLAEQYAYTLLGYTDGTDGSDVHRYGQAQEENPILVE